MNKLKFVFVVILSIVTISLFNNRVGAASTYKTNEVSSFANEVKVTLRGDGVVNDSGWAVRNTGQYSIYYKHSSSNYALCTMFTKDNADKTYNCKKDTSGWSSDEAVSSGVASIILKATGGINKTLSIVDYFNAELAVNKYLTTTKYKKSANNVSYKGKNLDTINKLSSVGNTAAKEISKFKNKSMKLKVGKITCSSGTCRAKVTFNNVKEKSTAYDNVSVSAVNVEVQSTNLKSGISASYDRDSHMITITNVKANTGSSSLTVKATATVKRSYYVAQNYTCGDNQSITLNAVKKKEASRSIKGSNSISFENTTGGEAAADSSTIVTTNSCDLMLYKISSTDDPLKDAKFELFIDGGSHGIVDFNVSSGMDGDIANGYCVGSNWNSLRLVENVAPAGYKKSNVELTSLPEDGEYEIKDVPNTNLIVKKIDGDSKKMVSGATLQMYQDGEIVKWNYVDANGNVTTTPVEDGNGNYYAKADENGANTSWTTSSKGINFIELPYEVEYRIEEIKAPDKYIVNNPSTVVTLTNTDAGRNKTVEVVDYLSSISISKQDITSKQELPGAKLQIVDGQGNVYEEWTSTNKPHVVTTLADGLYYLIETTAPSGYELNTEKISFEVENGKAKTNVVMYNAPKKVTVADTLFNKTVMTYVIGGILIIAGAGVLFYEIKKKKRA